MKVSSIVLERADCQICTVLKQLLLISILENLNGVGDLNGTKTGTGIQWVHRWSGMET